MEKSAEALKRLHDELRREKLEKQENNDEEEWIRLQRTGGGAET
tara:strand:- start:641 stop:772 length:132 start_codon:yes stop_codon:yes gene_type:complete